MFVPVRGMRTNPRQLSPPRTQSLHGGADRSGYHRTENPDGFGRNRKREQTGSHPADGRASGVTGTWFELHEETIPRGRTGSPVGRIPDLEPAIGVVVRPEPTRPPGIAHGRNPTRTTRQENTRDQQAHPDRGEEPRDTIRFRIAPVPVGGSQDGRPERARSQSSGSRGSVRRHGQPGSSRYPNLSAASKSPISR